MTAQRSVPASGTTSTGRLSAAHWHGGAVWARRLGGLAALLVAWWLASGTLVSSTVLPTPASVVDAGYTWVFGPKSNLAWWSGTWINFVLLSAKRMFIGYVIATITGIVLGLLIAWYRGFGETVDPIVQLLRPIPVVAWFPLVVAIFGISELASIALVVIGSVFPIVIYTADGAMHTPENLLRAALMLGTKRRRLLTRIVLPWALPAIFSGLRVALGLAWVLVIVSEMLAVRGGIGYALWSAYQFNRMSIVLAVMATMGLLGFFSDRLLIAIRNRALAWKVGS
jgi:NitT/TauT family transport system permease protein